MRWPEALWPASIPCADEALDDAGAQISREAEKRGRIPGRDVCALTLRVSHRRETKRKREYV